MKNITLPFHTVGETEHLFCFHGTVLLPAYDMPARGGSDINCKIIVQRKALLYSNASREKSFKFTDLPPQTRLPKPQIAKVTCPVFSPEAVDVDTSASSIAIFSLTLPISFRHKRPECRYFEIPFRSPRGFHNDCG